MNEPIVEDGMREVEINELWMRNYGMLAKYI